MKKDFFKKAIYRILKITFLYVLLLIPCLTNMQSKAVYAETSYPVQEVRFGIGDTDRNVCISSTSSGAKLISSTITGDRNEKWYLKYVSSGVYKIVNSQTDYVLTMSGSNCYISKDIDSNEQKWKIVGVQKDFEGQYLYYQIVNYSDSTKALTFSETTGNFSLASYTGSIDQKFKLNCDGQEGFAANCVVSSGEKAGTIGGLLGQTVYVDTVDELENALNSTDPLTVVVTGNIDCKNAGYTRIRDNKTLVGSYSARTIQDCQLRTNNEYGIAGDEPSDNIIIRNIDFEAVNNQNKILVQIWSSRYIWIDHCNFNAQFTCDKSEVGKFIWINTPYDSYMDAKDLDRSPDYITLSYNNFTNRYWTVAYGTQNSETSRCRTSIMYNTWDSCARRCPQIGNGTGHVYNNYYKARSSGNLSGTSQIIAGEGSTILSENCRFEGLTGYEVSVDSAAAYNDNGSYTSTSSSDTPYSLASKLSAHNTTSWTPSKSNYGYELLHSYNAYNYDTKTFCTRYAGSFSSYSAIKYATDSDVSAFIEKTYSAPFLRSITIDSSSSSTITEGTYMIKNVNSGLYMDVAGGTAANGTNVQQWGASSPALYNTWKIVSAGDGYYYIYSQVGDGQTYLLDVTSHSAENGANIEIYRKSGSTGQLFKFVENSDGSYTILTKSSNDSKCVEVVNGYAISGANVQQYDVNGYSCQHWILEKTDGINTSKIYALQNAASGLYMDVAGGTAANGTNVQQWGAASSFGGYNTWKFVSAGNGYYYIYSQVGDGNTYLLDVANNGVVNGTNIQIYKNTSCDAQLYKLRLNDDGTYTILTKSSSCASCVEVKNASNASGANVQEWELNNSDCQNWILKEVN